MAIASIADLTLAQRPEAVAAVRPAAGAPSPSARGETKFDTLKRVRKES